jgi:hypothetical protein
MNEITWISKFIASEKQSDVINKPSDSGITKLIIRGNLIDNTVNKNGWCIEEEDYEFIAKDFINKQIRSDHQERVSSVIGKITSTEIDSPHSEDKSPSDPANSNPHIHFEAEISTSDNNILIPIKMGYVTGVSPAVDSRQLLCNECREQMVDKNIKRCRCKGGGVLLKEISARELSLVCSPAFDNTNIKVYGFAAAVDQSSLSEDKILAIVEDELSRR